MNSKEIEKIKKKTYQIYEEDDLLKYINKDIKAGSGPVYIFFEARPESYSKELISDLSRLTKKIVDLGYAPEVSFYTQQLYLDDEELDNIIDYYLSFDGKVGVAFNQDYYVEYTLDEMINAQTNAAHFLKIVKGLKLSPFERFLITQNYVTSREYQDNEEDPNNSRDLIKVLNGQDIVCVGYAEMMNYLLDELGVKCVSQQCIVYEKETGKFLSNHENNIVYIEDSKYNIKGWYYLDSCWDSKEPRQEPFLRYNFGLIPLSDVQKMRIHDVKIWSGFFGALYSDEETNDLYEEMINNPQISERVAEEVCLEEEYNNFYEVLDSADKNLQDKKVRACQRLRELLKQENVPSDLFKKGEVPQESSIEMMLANLMQDKVDENVLQKSIDGLKCFINLKNQGELDDEDYEKTQSTVNNIYKFLDNFEKGKSLSQKENDCVVFLEEKLRDFRFAKYVQKILYEAKHESRVISLQDYQKGIENINLIQGTSKAFAKSQAQRAIDYSVKLSEMFFKEDADNCFRKEALRRRQEGEWVK